MSEFHDLDRRVAVLEQIAADIRASLQRLESRLDRLDDKLARELVALRAFQWSQFRWLAGIMLGGFAGLLAAIAHGFHWY